MMAGSASHKGHLRIPNALWEAMIRAGLSGGQYAVLLAIIRKTLGWHKQEDAISLATIVEMTGFTKRTVLRCIPELKARNMIAVARGGGRGRLSAFRFNSDWETWTPANSASTRETVTDPSLFRSGEKVTGMSPFTEEKVTGMSPFMTKNVTFSGCKPLIPKTPRSPKNTFKRQIKKKDSGFARETTREPSVPSLRFRPDFAAETVPLNASETDLETNAGVNSGESKGAGSAGADSPTAEVFELWNSLPSVMHHRTVRCHEKAIRRALANYTATEIKLAMRRYSAVRQNSEGKYRSVYSWPLSDFLSWKDQQNLERFNTEAWEEPFMSFDAGKTVKTLSSAAPPPPPANPDDPPAVPPGWRWLKDETGRVVGLSRPPKPETAAMQEVK